MGDVVAAEAEVRCASTPTAGSHRARRSRQRYVPGSSTRCSPTSFLTTHPMAPEPPVDCYDTFKHTRDGCLRCVLTP